MNGLIQQAQAPQQMPPQAEQEAPEADENDPNFQQAMQFAMEVLYSKGEAKNVATTLQAKGNDPAQALADTAYEITSVVDERTEGRVPDELLVLLASRILEEVADIAEAAGFKLQPADIAEALKQMILRFLGEQGVDTTQLQAAMDQVDPAEFNKLAEAQQ